MHHWLLKEGNNLERSLYCACGDPSESIPSQKQRQIVELAERAAYTGEIPPSNRMYTNFVSLLTKFHCRCKIIIVCFIQKTQVTLEKDMLQGPRHVLNPRLQDRCQEFNDSATGTRGVNLLNRLNFGVSISLILF